MEKSFFFKCYKKLLKFLKSLPGVTIFVIFPSFSFAALCSVFMALNRVLMVSIIPVIQSLELLVTPTNKQAKHNAKVKAAVIIGGELGSERESGSLKPVAKQIKYDILVYTYLEYRIHKIRWICVLVTFDLKNRSARRWQYIIQLYNCMYIFEF